MGDPNKQATCLYPDCPVCITSQGEPCIPKKGPTRCHVPNIGYRITCLRCQEEGKVGIYYGESARPGYVRGKEHREDLKFKRERSVLSRHADEIHQGEMIPWKMEVTGSFKSCLERQIDEATRISNNVDSADYILNGKDEWNGAVNTKWSVPQEKQKGRRKTPKEANQTQTQTQTQPSPPTKATAKPQSEIKQSAKKKRKKRKKK